ncbi:MAG: hypothetical protein MUP08_09135, partial [Desulfobulbaceae bacterium]|nr:hypothetical protein [Desulfobulbaceae bacterium]
WSLPFHRHKETSEPHWAEILDTGFWISIGNHAFFSQHPGSSIQHHLMYSDSREVRVKNDDPKIIFLNSIVSG